MNPWYCTVCGDSCVASCHTLAPRLNITKTSHNQLSFKLSCEFLLQSAHVWVRNGLITKIVFHMDFKSSAGFHNVPLSDLAPHTLLFPTFFLLTPWGALRWFISVKHPNVCLVPWMTPSATHLYFRCCLHSSQEQLGTGSSTKTLISSCVASPTFLISEHVCGNTPGVMDDG